ncbi:MAG TPA: LysR family transcriptional regulator [Pseudonocardiaceae bacterium]|nr:LysR family transcriptional regulator [Pseudonocardiaceae bacterium]
MDTRHLETFAAVVDTGSFTKAATVLRCSQPTVTTRIKALEQSVGMALLERLPNEVKLTAAGCTLLRYARDILALSDEAQVALTSDRPVAGRLDIGTVESVMTYRLLPLVEYMYRRYSNVRISMHASNCGETMSQLRDGRLDCVFFVDVVARRRDLDVEVLCPEPLVLVGGPDHLLVGRPDVSDDEVRSATLIRAETGANYHDQFERLFGAGNPDERARVLDLDSIDMAKRSVAAGLGLALLPEIAVEEELAAGELHRIDWSAPFHVFTQLAWRRGSGSHATLRALVTAAVQVVNEQSEAQA